MRWRVTRRLPAIDADGRPYTVVEMQMGGEIDYILDNGFAVTRQADETFRIDETGEIVSIIDR